MRAIVEIARTIETPGLSQAVAHRHQLQTANHRQIVRVSLPFRHSAGHLDKLHAQIEEYPLMRRRPAIGNQVAPHDVAAEQAILRVLVLAAPEPDAVAGLAARYLDPQLRGRILWKAIQEHARGRLLHRRRCFALEGLDARTAQWLQFAGRRGSQPCGLPRAIIKPWAVPTRLLRPHIEILTGIYVGEDDRSFRSVPRFIGADPCGDAAGRLAPDLSAEQERLVGLSLRAGFVVAARGRIGIVPE